jgi:hypothetical protein
MAPVPPNPAANATGARFATPQRRKNEMKRTMLQLKISTTNVTNATNTTPKIIIRCIRVIRCSKKFSWSPWQVS